MLETEKLDELFSLLREMTSPLLCSPGAKPLLIMWRVLVVSLTGLSFLVIMSLWLSARWRHYAITLSEFQDAQFVLNCIFEVLGLILVTVSLFYIIWIITRHRKELALYLFSKNYVLHRDAQFIKRLLKFDKATLAYGLLQYPHSWLPFEDIVPVLVGDLRKIGAYPALAALLISAAILFKEDSSPFILILGDLMAIVVIGYVVGFLSFLSSKRPRQVVQLLEYAIQHVDQGNAIPPDDNHLRTSRVCGR